MRPLLLTLCLAALPVLCGRWVNQTAPHPPTEAYVAARRTRYCYAHACPHATAANSPAYWRLRPLYGLVIAGLSAGGWGAVRAGERTGVSGIHARPAAGAHLRRTV